MDEPINVTPEPQRRTGLKIFGTLVLIAGLGAIGWQFNTKRQEKMRAEIAAQEAKDAAVAAEKLRLERIALFGDRAVQRGVTFRPSGLGFRVMERGTWAAPKPTDIVRITYTGRLKDGKVFDRTTKAMDFRLTELVPGLSAGLQLLQPGGQIELFVPPNLGYGERETAGIPPGSGLIFEVALIEVNPTGS